ncbi:hypothetical protein RHMOL_Rhmol05G0119900 [Rhododendron molle]|uniref:Uncharacterized protein n=1 Tax=Rhododendron molle TaxID=49168 RepID=A0ACC0NP13_RHOML|nr:hypothetical protein RHMOL_Rhmol05G0119900 [Rhododendron molle]
MGRKKIRSTIEEIPKRRLNLSSGRYEMNLPKVHIKKKAAEYALKNRLADGKIRAAEYAMQSRFNKIKESNGDGQKYSHDSDVMKQSRGSWLSSLATGSGDELSSPAIVRCVKSGDVEIVKEIDGVVYLKEHSGEEVRLDPAILFADVSEADRSRLLKVFAQRPDTFMRMGSLGSFFVRFALESFSRMWGMLESTTIGDLSEEELDDLLKSFGDMQRCLIKTDWLEARLKRMGRLKKAKLEGIDKLKTINIEREKARAEIEELKVLLSKAEEKKHKLDEAAQALGAKSEEDISLEWSVVESLFAGRMICGKHAGVVQNCVKKRNIGEVGEEGWLEGQQKDEQKGRRRYEGIRFAGKEHYVEGASRSENFSELVLMAGGKPVAVLMRYSV